ncbi:MAG: response regulator, partial [Akkermansiaceae bacterium]|nr:response regulator [Verrucomicrobiales bacterium]
MEKELSRIPLKILHLEDDVHDAEILHSFLEADGIVCDLRRVDTRADYAAALETPDWDLIISDFSLPSYDGLRALALAKEKVPGIPFILFSGTIGEETAVECLKRGAADYVLKQRPARLVSAVRQTMREAEEHRRFKAMQEELRKSEEQARQLETQCLRMQRMESIGALVGGVAHDLNNALVPILIGVDYLQTENLQPNSREMLKTMRASARRGAE